MTNDVTTDAVETAWNPTRTDIRRVFSVVLAKTPYAMIAGVVVAIGLLGTALDTTTTPNGTWVISPDRLLAVLPLAALFACLPHLVGLQVWYLNRLVRVRKRVRLDPAGVTSASDLITMHYAWTALKVAFETDRFFALATNRGPGTNVVIVPKAGLGAGELVTARALITDNVGQIRRGKDAQVARVSTSTKPST